MANVVKVEVRKASNGDMVYFYDGDFTSFGEDFHSKEDAKSSVMDVYICESGDSYDYLMEAPTIHTYEIEL